MAIAGLIGTESWQGANQKRNPALEVLYRVNPRGKEAQFTQLSTKLKGRKFHPNNEIRIAEQDHRPLELIADSAITAVATLINVRNATGSGNDHTRHLRAGSTLELVDSTTGVSEIAIVVVDPTIDGQLSIQRGWGGTTPAAVNADEAISIRSYASEEGAEIPRSSSVAPSEILQYMEIFQRSVSVTRSASKVALQYGYEPQAPYRDEKLKEMGNFSIDMEQAFFFHPLHKDTYNGQPRRTCEGIVPFVTSKAPTNVIDGGATGTVQENALLDLTRIMGQYGDEFVVFQGATAANAWGKYLSQKTVYQVSEPESEYGFRLRRVSLPNATLVFLPPHPILSKNSRDSSLCVLMNLEKVGMLYLDDVQFVEDPADNFSSLRKVGQWYAECAPIWRTPQAHGVIRNLKCIAPAGACP